MLSFRHGVEHPLGHSCTPGNYYVYHFRVVIGKIYLPALHSARRFCSNYIHYIICCFNPYKVFVHDVFYGHTPGISYPRLLRKNILCRRHSNRASRYTYICNDSPDHADYQLLCEVF